MGELMRSSLNNVCCYQIIQAEFAKYFKLSENGLVVLTRKISEIKNDEYSQSDAIVGTYSYLNNSKVVILQESSIWKPVKYHEWLPEKLTILVLVERLEDIP